MSKFRHSFTPVFGIVLYLSTQVRARCVSCRRIPPSIRLRTILDQSDASISCVIQIENRIADAKSLNDYFTDLALVCDNKKCVKIR